MTRNRLKIELFSATLTLVCLSVLPIFSSVSLAADHVAPHQHASMQWADTTEAMQSAEPIGSGDEFTDRSFRFSEPIAGNNTPGSTLYKMPRQASEILPPSESHLSCAVIDPISAGYAYFGTGWHVSPGRVVKVYLRAHQSPPARVGAVTLNPGESRLSSAVIDPAAGYAYFGTYTSPGRVVKVALGTGVDPFGRFGAVTLNPGEDYLRSAVIDPAAGYAYFGTATSPGRVVKIALATGANVGHLSLNTGENYLASAVIDPAAGYAYFGTGYSAAGRARVVKVALGTGANPPTRVGAVELNEGENALCSAVIDPAAGYAYFCTATNPGRVVKVALGTGSDTPSRVGAVTLNAGESLLMSAVIDPAAGYAYFGTGWSEGGGPRPGRVVKVALGAGANPPTRVGAVELNEDEHYLMSAVFDPITRYAYFGTQTDPGRVVRVAPGSGSNPPYRVDARSLKVGELVFDCGVGGDVWFPSGEVSGYTKPGFPWGPDYLGLISSTNTNTFGYWVSWADAASAYADYLYRARFTVSTDITDQSLVPQIRLRANSVNFQQYDVLSIESAGQGESSPTVGGTDYDLYFVPPSNAPGLPFSFDLLNFNPEDAAVAELMLHTVTLDRFLLSERPTPTVVQDYTFDDSREGWTHFAAPIFFTPPLHIRMDGALQLWATTNTDTFGYWASDPADITIEADRLYCGIFEVRTDITDSRLVPEMRFRFNAGNFQTSQAFGIASHGDGANSPGTTNTIYDRLYFLPPATCVGEALIVSFDILNFNPNDAATAKLILDHVTIESLLPPPVP